MKEEVLVQFRKSVLLAAGWDRKYTTKELKPGGSRLRSQLWDILPLFVSLVVRIDIGAGLYQTHLDLAANFSNKCTLGSLKSEVLAYGNLTDAKRIRMKLGHMDTTVGHRDCYSVSLREKQLNYQSHRVNASSVKNLCRFPLGLSSVHHAEDAVRSGTTQREGNMASVYHLAVAISECLTVVLTFNKGISFTTREKVTLIKKVYEPACQRLAGYYNGTYNGGHGCEILRDMTSYR